MEREREEEKLAAWLRERELDESIAMAFPGAPAETAGFPKGTSLSIGQTGEEITAGDIVLLPPYGPFTSERPVYVAIARPIADDRWEVVPFSRFSVPATGGEWSTGREAAPLKVLCPWNRGELPAAFLRAGWRVERLTGEEQRWIRGEEDPAEERKGPPLLHPLDPRHDYLEEEKALWFDGEGVGYQSADCVEEGLPQAADKKGDGYE